MNLLWLIPALPFFGGLLLVIFGSKFTKGVSGTIGAGSVGLAALITLVVGYDFLSTGQEFYRHVAWNWFSVGDLSASFAFYLDRLSLVFIFVITFVGFLIHIYSIGFMAHDEGFTRFFAYLNLFVCSMLILVLSDNLILMYLGWEG